MTDHKLKAVISPEEIHCRVKELANEIERDFHNAHQIVAIGILKGAFIFLADLLRNMDIPVQVDFLRVTSYGMNAVSSGHVKVTKDIELNIEGKHVLLVEDIVDTGLSLLWVEKYLLTKHPASLKVCVFIDKKERRMCDVQVDYVGFALTQGFLVGYGLDYSENYRHLPGIYEICFSDA